MDTFFSAQTYGLLFNDRLSAVLKVPLLSTSLRSHLHAKILEQQTHEHLRWVQRVLDALGDEAPVRQVTPPLLSTVPRHSSSRWSLVTKICAHRPISGRSCSSTGGSRPGFGRSCAYRTSNHPIRPLPRWTPTEGPEFKSTNGKDTWKNCSAPCLGERARLTVWRNTFVVAE